MNGPTKDEVFNGHVARNHVYLRALELAMQNGWQDADQIAIKAVKGYDAIQTLPYITHLPRFT
jgi:hypothetical protein